MFQLTHRSSTWPRELESLATLSTLGLSGNLFPLPIPMNITKFLPTIQNVYLGRDSEDVDISKRIVYPTAYSSAPNLRELSLTGLYTVRSLEPYIC